MKRGLGDLHFNHYKINAKFWSLRPEAEDAGSDGVLFFHWLISADSADDEVDEWESDGLRLGHGITANTRHATHRASASISRTIARPLPTGLTFLVATFKKSLGKVRIFETVHGMTSVSA